MACTSHRARREKPTVQAVCAITRAHLEQLEAGRATKGRLRAKVLFSAPCARRSDAFAQKSAVFGIKTEFCDYSKLNYSLWKNRVLYYSRSNLYSFTYNHYHHRARLHQSLKNTPKWPKLLTKLGFNAKMRHFSGHKTLHLSQNST